jgi:hypothetical protein
MYSAVVLKIKKLAVLDLKIELKIIKKTGLTDEDSCHEQLGCLNRVAAKTSPSWTLKLGLPIALSGPLKPMNIVLRC